MFSVLKGGEAHQISVSTDHAYDTPDHSALRSPCLESPTSFGFPKSCHLVCCAPYRNDLVKGPPLFLISYPMRSGVPYSLLKARRQVIRLLLTDRYHIYNKFITSMCCEYKNYSPYPTAGFRQTVLSRALGSRP